MQIVYEDEKPAKYEHVFDIRFSVFSDEENFWDIPNKDIRVAVQERIREVLDLKEIKEACNDKERWELRDGE